MKLQLILSVALLATACAASAQTVPHPGACKADASKLCPDAVAAMDRTAVQACLTQSQYGCDETGQCCRNRCADQQIENLALRGRQAIVAEAVA